MSKQCTRPLPGVRATHGDRATSTASPGSRPQDITMPGAPGSCGEDTRRQHITRPGLANAKLRPRPIMTGTNTSGRPCQLDMRCHRDAQATASLARPIPSGGGLGEDRNCDGAGAAGQRGPKRALSPPVKFRGLKFCKCRQAPGQEHGRR